MEFLTVKEFAERVRVCRHTIFKALKAGKIYAIRVGIGKKSPYRIPVTELERLQVVHKFENSK